MYSTLIFLWSHSKSTISNITNTVKIDVEQWLNRKLDRCYSIIYIDATYWHTRREECVSKDAFIPF